MTTERETLQIIGSWMEEGRTRLPDHVLDAVLDQLPSTPQRRTMLGLPWRFPPMPSSARLALTIVAIAAVGVVGLTLVQGPMTGPAASPSPTPSLSLVSPPPSPFTPPPSPFTGRFDSAVHGLSISYPAGWETRPATEPWKHDVVTFGASEIDVIIDPTLQADLYIALVSEPLRGLSGEAWVNGVNGVDVCGPRRDGEGVTGGSYRLDSAKGFAVSRVRGAQPAGCQYVAAATETRGYIIRLHVGDEGHPEAYGWGWFESVLETVDLRPEEAIDALSPSASP
jgi:hypothetical protein